MSLTLLSTWYFFGLVGKGDNPKTFLLLYFSARALVVMFRLCMGTHFATCDHDAVHKICARSATRYTLLILLPRPGTHFIHTLKVITRDHITYIFFWRVCRDTRSVVTNTTSLGYVVTRPRFTRFYINI